MIRRGPVSEVSIGGIPVCRLTGEVQHEWLRKLNGKDVPMSKDEEAQLAEAMWVFNEMPTPETGDYSKLIYKGETYLNGVPSGPKQQTQAQ